jgi:hypothetical protein
MLAFPTIGSAVTVGSDLKGTPSPNTGYGCGTDPGNPPCTIEQISLPGDPHMTRAPFSGVIRKWRFRTTFDGGPTYELRLRVVRKVAPNKWRFIRHTAHRETGTAAGTYTFGAHLAIKKGDFIALDLPGDGANVQEFYVDHPKARYNDWFPAPLDGPVTMPTHHQVGIEFFYNATVRHRHHH